MFWLAPFLLFQLQQPLDIPAANPHTTAADIEQGRRLYMGRCAGCHGPTGDGGKGANLASPTLSRAAEDRALYRIIRYGIPDTEMPGSLMDSLELWQTAAFVRSLGRVAVTPVTGNAANGAQIFRTKGACLGCHAMGAEGGRTGPPLAGIGGRRSATHLRAKIENPAADVPHTFRLVTLTTKAGKTLRGIRLNEDTFSIQLRDFSGNPHSVWKDEIAQFSSEKKTNMPAYKGRLTEAELNDLVAYLANEKGAQ
ncbi:MAG: c-type cytochrome [Bryobacterales bacterium]|nr:c-type cytochrome [Bryobacterales bacterium]